MNDYCCNLIMQNLYFQHGPLARRNVQKIRIVISVTTANGVCSVHHVPSHDQTASIVEHAKATEANVQNAVVGERDGFVGPNVKAKLNHIVAKPELPIHIS